MMIKHGWMVVAALALVGCDRAPSKSTGDAQSASKSKSETASKTDAADKEAKDAHAAFKIVKVDEFATMLKAGKALPIDANGKATRKKYGVIPSAVLLSGAPNSTAKELPSDKDKSLVFYCYNEVCNSAPRAAEAAKAAGYADVRVLAAGIKGWVDAGQTVDHPKS